MNEKELISSINKDLAIAIPETIVYDELHQLLAGYINEMIQKDFQKLVTILYRIDVDESKLKQMLRHENEEAGKIIASLIIERQLQKIKSRQQFSGRDSHFNDEERL